MGRFKGWNASTAGKAKPKAASAPAKPRKPKSNAPKKNAYSAIMDAMAVVCNLPPFIYEHRFDEREKPRRWKFDTAIIRYKIAIEIEGGVFTQGRHTRGAGAVDDMEKYNQATLQGWAILRFTPDQMQQVETYRIIERLVSRRLTQLNNQPTPPTNESPIH